MTPGSSRIRHQNQVLWAVAIVLSSALVGVMAAWRAPGLELYARDLLMRTRGNLPLPDDIVILAIDDASIARYGRFPWSRQLMAKGIDRIAAAQPGVIALDILYTDTTVSGEDKELADAIARAGNVVTAAQLMSAGGGAVWLRPLDAIEHAATGTGHVSVATGFDGVARVLPLRQSDDQGHGYWSMAIEAIRVADRIAPSQVRELPDTVQVGLRTIPANVDAHAQLMDPGTGSSTETLRAGRLWLDFVGPSGSFAPKTVSFGDVLDGRISSDALRGKYVLVGATAASIGERMASPFVRSQSRDGRQRAELMPGIEVLANGVNTILRGRFYQETPDWLAFLICAAVAAAVLLSLSLAQGRHETWKQLAALTILALVVLVSAYLTFTRVLIMPPLVPALISFVVATPLALLRRSLVMSSDLDARIGELATADAALDPSAGYQFLTTTLRPNPAALIARLTEASAVAIFERRTHASSAYLLVAQYGYPVSQTILNARTRNAVLHFPASKSVAGAAVQAGSADRFFDLSDMRQNAAGERAMVVQIDGYNESGSSVAHEVERNSGALILSFSAGREPSSDLLLACREMASGYLAAQARNELNGGGASGLLSKVWWPRGGEWKARALGVLYRQFAARARFVNLAFRSVEDGLILAAADGRIAFANPRAAEILRVPERALLETDLFDRLREAEQDGQPASEPGDERSVKGSRATRDALVKLVVERSPIEREIRIGDAPPRYYTLRLAAVTDSENGSGSVLGIVASLSDISRQRQLQQTKNDVMALVTHELRTPLTAIQGMSDVLSQFDVDSERRHEMHVAINDEAKRLARMIDEYLNITRLESGAQQLRMSPVRIAPVLERSLLMLDPVAGQRRIRLTRRLAPNLPPLVADADLIGRAVTNLVANAIKYSATGTEVVVEAREESVNIRIDVADQGCGIPTEDLTRVFEKFYRVPRVENVDVPGTGLGLALVREIAELHGGRVSVESEVGVGSTFTLRLPVPPE
jgi:signal transduction histidine kinase/CHASE2 domain-containing sensor protein